MLCIIPDPVNPWLYANSLTVAGHNLDPHIRLNVTNLHSAGCMQVTSRREQCCGAQRTLEREERSKCHLAFDEGRTDKINEEVPNDADESSGDQLNARGRNVTRWRM